MGSYLSSSEEDTTSMKESPLLPEIEHHRSRRNSSFSDWSCPFTSNSSSSISPLSSSQPKLSDSSSSSNKTHHFTFEVNATPETVWQVVVTDGELYAEWNPVLHRKTVTDHIGQEFEIECKDHNRSKCIVTEYVIHGRFTWEYVMGHHGFWLKVINRMQLIPLANGARTRVERTLEFSGLLSNVFSPPKCLISELEREHDALSIRSMEVAKVQRFEQALRLHDAELANRFSEMMNTLDLVPVRG